MASASSAARYAEPRSDMEPFRLQCGQDRLHAVGHCRDRRVYPKIRLCRLLVGLRNAGEAGNLPRACPLVEAFGVACFANGKRGVHKHFQELALLEQLANELPFVTEW